MNFNFCKKTSKCFIVMVNGDDNDEYLNQQLRQAHPITMHNALHKYLIGHDPDKYHITEECVTRDTMDVSKTSTSQNKSQIRCQSCINNAAGNANRLEEHIARSRETNVFLWSSSVKVEYVKTHLGVKTKKRCKLIESPSGPMSEKPWCHKQTHTV
jgi:hypothetical protein